MSTMPPIPSRESRARRLTLGLHRRPSGRSYASLLGIAIAFADNRRGREIRLGADRSGESVEQLVETARAAHGAGRLDEAARLYELVLAQERRHAGALHGLGLVHAHQGRLGEAIKLLRRAADAAPRSAEAQADLGA